MTIAVLLRPYGVTGGSGINYTLTCSSGAYAISGKAAVLTVKFNYALTCTTGAYAFSGKTTTLTIGHSLACSVGAYAFSGKAASSLVVGHRLTCAVGAYAFSGKALTTALAHALSCAAGAYAFSGKAPTSLKVAHSLSCAVGAYAFSGKAATLLYTPGGTPINFTLICSNGVYAFSGKAASLTATHNYVLSCAAGAYAFSGKAATFNYAPGLAGRSGVNRLWLEQLTAELNGMTDGRPTEELKGKIADAATLILRAEDDGSIVVIDPTQEQPKQKKVNKQAATATKKVQVDSTVAFFLQNIPPMPVNVWAEEKVVQLLKQAAQDAEDEELAIITAAAAFF